MDLTQSLIIHQVEEDKPVEIKFYENTHKYNILIKTAIEKVLTKYNRENLFDVIYFCIKELIANAILTNVKSLFFEKNNLNVNSISDYVAGITRFKAMLESRGCRKYYNELSKSDRWTKFKATHSKDGIKFEVTNNSPIFDIEEKQIRMKLQKSMIYVELLDDNYLKENNLYDPEDEKLGLALIAILMRKANLDVNLFRIGTSNGITLSRIEIPLSKEYKSSRQKK